jgi:hypothetical protein
MVKSGVQGTFGLADQMALRPAIELSFCAGQHKIDTENTIMESEITSHFQS